MAAGRTFKDRPSFVAKPDRVVFKDFIVGKVRPLPYNTDFLAIRDVGER